jgi:hypothetical protein
MHFQIKLLITGLILSAGLQSKADDNWHPPTTPVSGPPPSSRFDLSHWKLTLPFNKDHAYRGHAKEIPANQLAGGFKDPHFYTDAKGATIFWCPVNGSTT